MTKKKKNLNKDLKLKMTKNSMKFCLDGEFFDSPEESGIDVNKEEITNPSVFETLRTYDSHNIFAVEEHLKRLFKSAEILNITPYATQKTIEESLEKIVKANFSLSFDLRIKILLTKDYFWINTQKLISAPEKIYTQGVEVRSETFERPNSKAKYSSPKYLSFMESLRKEEFEIIFFDNKNFLREGNISNVFAVFGNTIVTPEERVLHGITRKKITELIKKDKNLTLEQREIHQDELQKADEIFLTNTTKEIVPVRKWGKWERQDFTVAQELRRKFQKSFVIL